VKAESRDRKCDQQRRCQAAPHDRVAQHGADDRRPEARIAVTAADAAAERDPAAVDAVAELREHRRQHREGADQRDRDDQNGAHAEGPEDA